MSTKKLLYLTSFLFVGCATINRSGTPLSSETKTSIKTTNKNGSDASEPVNFSETYAALASLRDKQKSKIKVDLTKAAEIATTLKKSSVDPDNSSDFQNRYPGLTAATDLHRSVSLKVPKERDLSETQIREVLKKGYDLAEQLHPSNCFDLTSQKIKSNPTCKELGYRCAVFGSDGQQLYGEMIDKNAVVKQIYLSNTKQYLEESRRETNSEAEYDEQNGKFLFCSLLAASGQKFSPYDFLGFTSAPWLENSGSDMRTMEAFASACTIDDKMEGAYKRFQKIKSERPDYFSLQLWDSAWSDFRGKCKNAATYWCSDVKILKETAILSYPTQNCEIRQVTANDVKRDLKRWEQIGMEEAARLSHEQLLDSILACQNAYDSGIDWAYVPPKIGDCKKAH